MGVHNEAENTKRFKKLELDATAKITGYSLINSCINKLMTEFGNENGNWYYLEPKIYPDKQKHTDGLILNDTQFLQERLLDPQNGESLKNQLHIIPEQIGHIKAIQFIFIEEISNNSILEICEAFQTIDTLLIIIGLNWPTYEYEKIITLPQNERIKYQENIKIIDTELFTDFIGLNDKYRTNFNNLIKSFKKMDYKALQKYHDANGNIYHDTDDLRDDLIQKGLIKEEIGEFLYFPGE